MYDLSYEESDVLKQEKTDNRHFKILRHKLKNIFVFVLIANVFAIAFSDVNLKFSFTKNVASSIVPSNENFGKLKFVDSQNMDYVQSDTGDVVLLTEPFFVCAFCDDVFVSLGNNALVSMMSGVVKNIGCISYNCKTFEIANEEVLVRYYGNFVLGLDENNSVVKGEILGFCLDGVCEIEVEIDGVIYKNNELFA